MTILSKNNLELLQLNKYSILDFHQEVVVCIVSAADVVVRAFVVLLEDNLEAIIQGEVDEPRGCAVAIFLGKKKAPEGFRTFRRIRNCFITSGYHTFPQQQELCGISSCVYASTKA